MNEQSSALRSFEDATFQAAAADFEASFSELLRAASLMERRPTDGVENPDVPNALKRARWLLVGAIESVERYRETCGNLPGGSSMTSDLLECLRALERVIARASASHFRAALSAFATTLTKGQQNHALDSAA